MGDGMSDGIKIFAKAKSFCLRRMIYSTKIEKKIKIRQKYPIYNIFVF